MRPACLFFIAVYLLSTRRATASVCGDGIWDSDEQCDASAHVDAVCFQYEGGPAHIECTAQCTFNTTICDVHYVAVAQYYDPTSPAPLTTFAASRARCQQIPVPDSTCDLLMLSDNVTLCENLLVDNPFNNGITGPDQLYPYWIGAIYNGSTAVWLDGTPFSFCPTFTGPSGSPTAGEAISVQLAGWINGALAYTSQSTAANFMCRCQATATGPVVTSTAIETQTSTPTVTRSDAHVSGSASASATGTQTRSLTTLTPVTRNLTATDDATANQPSISDNPSRTNGAVFPISSRVAVALPLACLVVMAVISGVTVRAAWRHKRRRQIVGKSEVTSIKSSTILVTSSTVSGSTDNSAPSGFVNIAGGESFMQSMPPASPKSFQSIELYDGERRWFVSDHVIGSGGQGSVYKALDQAGMMAAVKICDNSPAECAILTHISHPNVVTVYGTVSKVQGQMFIIMEWVSGGSLATLVKLYGTLNDQQLQRYMFDCCSALAYLYESNVMHRDIKPENILLTPDGRAKLTDFGIARGLDSVHVGASSSSITQMAGTVAYMPPEAFSTKALPLSSA